jgi:hypothetical protein
MLESPISDRLAFQVITMAFMAIAVLLGDRQGYLLLCAILGHSLRIQMFASIIITMRRIHGAG